MSNVAEKDSCFLSYCRREIFTYDFNSSENKDTIFLIPQWSCKCHLPFSQQTENADRVSYSGLNKYPVKSLGARYPLVIIRSTSFSSCFEELLTNDWLSDKCIILYYYSGSHEVLHSKKRRMYRECKEGWRLFIECPANIQWVSGKYPDVFWKLLLAWL